MNKIILAPNYEQAQEYVSNNFVAATVEAEYGDNVVEGRAYTLAHHGPRSGNPAPCNSEVKRIDGTILVSHIDLDTIGGVLALCGSKPEDKRFWEGAEFIDINGIHHMHELDQNVQDKLNAFYAWTYTQDNPRYAEITDVTERIKNAGNYLNIILDPMNIRHSSEIRKGMEWEKETTAAVERNLKYEDENIRTFVTDGVFCSVAYYSPEDKKIKKATITLNTKFNSITVAFADGGKEFSAKDFVQSLWGPEAGGRDGIAGSPRGQIMTEKDLEKAAINLSEMIAGERNQLINKNPNAEALFDPKQGIPKPAAAAIKPKI